MKFSPMKWIKNYKEKIESKKIQSLFILRNDRKEFEQIPLEIVSGKYTGLVYHYGRVLFPDENTVEFEYFPIMNAYLIEDKEDFYMFAGKILVYMLEKREYYDIIDQDHKSEG